VLLPLLRVAAAASSLPVNSSPRHASPRGDGSAATAAAATSKWVASSNEAAASGSSARRRGCIVLFFWAAAPRFTFVFTSQKRKDVVRVATGFMMYVLRICKLYVCAMNIVFGCQNSRKKTHPVRALVLQLPHRRHSRVFFSMARTPN
jgi:hypothetical protein